MSDLQQNEFDQNLSKNEDFKKLVDDFKKLSEKLEQHIYYDTICSSFLIEFARIVEKSRSKN